MDGVEVANEVDVEHPARMMLAESNVKISSTDHFLINLVSKFFFSYFSLYCSKIKSLKPLFSNSHYTGVF